MIMKLLIKILINKKKKNKKMKDLKKMAVKQQHLLEIV